MMRGILELVKTIDPDIEFKHVLDFQREGVKDREWIPARAAEGWVLISADRNKGTSSKGDGGSLPLLCQQFGMTHILLGTAVHGMKQFEKAQAIVGLWNEIVSAIKGAKGGSRFLIRKLRDKIVLEPRGDGEQTTHATPKISQPRIRRTGA